MTGTDARPWLAGPPVAEPLLSVLTESRRRHLIGPLQFDDQVSHSAGFSRPLGAGTRVLDLGSGGGLPGLVLSVGRPDLELTLTDSAQRRVRFLEWAIEELGVGARVRVLWGRVEDLGRDPGFRGGFDGVVARSFGAPAVTAECARPFLRTGGVLVVSEPPATGTDPTAARLVAADANSADANSAGADGESESDSERWDRLGLAELGMRPLEAYRFTTGGRFEAAGYQVLEAVGDCPHRLPRRAGVPSRRPLF